MGNASKKKARATRAQQKKNKSLLLWGVVIAAIIGGGWWLSQGASVLPDVMVGEDAGVYEDDWMKGGENARVTLIEFGDFQCPACARVSSVVNELHEKFPDDLRIVFRHFPLVSIHPNAQSAAWAAEAAGRQGKFWEMHDLLFERQNQWSGTTGNPINFYTQYAGELGLDLDQFGEDFNSRSVKDKVARNNAEAKELGLRGTPSFLLNGEQITVPGTQSQFEQLIEAAIANAPAPEIESVDVHEHADIAVYVNDRQLDFSADKYQSSEDNYMHEYMHFHDGIGSVIHKHRTGFGLGDFFESIGIGLSDACLTLDTGERYCNTNTKSLKFFVNGEERTGLASYQFADLDQLLISYGPVDEDVTDQLASISDQACIFSETCPERGAPPAESCVGGLGTTCDTGEDDHGHDEETDHQAETATTNELSA